VVFNRGASSLAGPGKKLLALKPGMERAFWISASASEVGGFELGEIVEQAAQIEKSSSNMDFKADNPTTVAFKSLEL
jgi:hypothetical protein